FKITYTDNNAVDPSTLGNGDLSIVGPNGMTIPLTLVSTSGSGASITAIYQITAPGGNWHNVPYGTYVISQVAGQVRDTSGNAALTEPLGSFQITVSPPSNLPTNPASTPINFTAAGGSSSIRLTWSDPAADQLSFNLQRATNASFSQNLKNFPLTANSISYTDSAVVSGQTYYYRLIATNQIGSSSPTATVSASMSAGAPAAPVLSNVVFDDGNSARSSITS